EIECDREELSREARHWRDHALQFRQNLELLPLLHRKEIAMDTGSGVLVLATSEPGHFLFGPYLPLGAGRYSLSFRFRAAWVLRPNEPVLTVEIAAGDAVLAVQVVSTDVPGSSHIEFTVPPDFDATNIEFRLSHHANASLEVLAVQLSAPRSTQARKSRLSVPSFLRRSLSRLSTGGRSQPSRSLSSVPACRNPYCFYNNTVVRLFTAPHGTEAKRASPPRRRSLGSAGYNHSGCPLNGTPDA